MLRQNRDLAKLNNIRALRIRDLENECARLLSENLELRGRVLELEKEADNNEFQRIADHALAIKTKLESQLTEWGTMLAGLGLEPPIKRHSPRINRPARPRLSFNSTRPSPSQRRLRDIAKDIEELGHIHEHKSTSRMSMYPEQIQALRSEANSSESPELGPPPVSKFIECEPVKIDSPSRPPSAEKLNLSPIRPLDSPVAFSSDVQATSSPSPQKKREPLIRRQELKLQTETQTTAAETHSIKVGAKRKLSARDETDISRALALTKDDQSSRPIAISKSLIRDKVGGKSLKELANMRKESRENSFVSSNPRKPLASKSTNDGVSSPKKAVSKPGLVDEVAAAKADFIKAKASQERPKPKAKNPPVAKVEAINIVPPASTTISADLRVPLTETTLLSPTSPEPVLSGDGPRGDTPPPFDITSNGETTRPSRRNKTAISYAEPNLRVKMRRPTKELFDAVTGEGRYVRRTSQCEPFVSDVKAKRESDVRESLKHIPALSAESAEPEAIAVSPLANKTSASRTSTGPGIDTRRRASAVASKQADATTMDDSSKATEDSLEDEASRESTDVDLYEFTTSSPQPTKSQGRRKTSSRASRASRRFSSMVEDEDSATETERPSSRRRSMML